MKILSPHLSVKLKEFYKHLLEIQQLEQIDSLLNWDTQVCMPHGGGSSRFGQIELVSKLIYRRRVNPELKKTTEDLFQNLPILDENDAVNLRETKRVLDRQSKLNEDFVSQKARLFAESYLCWKEARSKNSFKMVLPYLEKCILSEKKEAELVGYKEAPYDALLDRFEPGETLKRIKPLFLNLAEKLNDIIPTLLKKSKDIPFALSHYPLLTQQQLGLKVAQDLGYDLSKGRLDQAPHPFQASIGDSDVRITTRYSEKNYLSSLFTVLHETGHALYELGFLDKHRGTPMAAPVSLGIHESQSRLWENLIGRSRAFSVYLYRLLEKFFPEEYAKTSPDEIWQRANFVHPSLIRVEADEVTYSLHIVIRILLEEALINGNLSPKDLPSAWKELYKKYLDIHVPNNKDGVLQDVHWYSIGMGYFPTYALGNFYAAIMLHKARSSLQELDSLIEKGNFRYLLGWLRVNVHQHGMKYGAKELIHRISGEELGVKFFIDYICNKFDLNVSTGS